MKRIFMIIFLFSVLIFVYCFIADPFLVRPEKRSLSLKLALTQKLSFTSFNVSWVKGIHDTIIYYDGDKVKLMNISTKKIATIMSINNQFDILQILPSPDGKEILISNGVEVHLYNTENNTRRILSMQKGSWLFDWSPDSKKIVYTRHVIDKGFGEIWKMDMESKKPQKLMDEGYWIPKWSPKGGLLAFRKGLDIICIAKEDGTRLREIVHASTPAYEWTPNGRKLIYFAEGILCEYDIDTKIITQLANIPIQSLGNHIFSISPDEKYIAFSFPQYIERRDEWTNVSAELKGSDIYILPLKVEAKAFNIINSKDIYEYYPKWSPTGNDIFYPERNNAVPLILHLGGE